MNTFNKFFNNFAKYEHGCWPWTGAINNKGYGTIWHDGKNRKAHRISWRIFNGEIPEGLMVLHRCDNRRCVNPMHLFTGTAQDNVDDMMSKGRGIKARGSGHGNAVFTEDQVREIKKKFFLESQSVRGLARQFNTGKTTISHIVKGESWKHVTI